MRLNSLSDSDDHGWRKDNRIKWYDQFDRVKLAFLYDIVFICQLKTGREFGAVRHEHISFDRGRAQLGRVSSAV